MIREQITVNIDVESDELCGGCHMLIPMEHFSWWCKAYITELWTKGNEARRCDECKKRAVRREDGDGL